MEIYLVLLKRLEMHPSPYGVADAPGFASHVSRAF